MDISNSIQTFQETGRILSSFPANETEPLMHLLANAAEESQRANPWFTAGNVRYALNALGDAMSVDKFTRWLTPYSEQHENRVRDKVIGVVTAGNIPLAGFHDFLCVLISGNKFCGKLSGQDNILLPAIAELVVAKNPRLKDKICFTDQPFKNVDAVIATGSGNTFRYFEHYFKKYPHIIRRNRNGVAVLDGNETEDQLFALASDVMLYFGLGCRNVSKIYLPEGYDVLQLKKYFEPWDDVIRHHKYVNNYDYRKSIFIVNRQNYLDFGNLLLTEDSMIASPVSVLHYSFYRDRDALAAELLARSNEIQCIVAAVDPGIPYVNPGCSQLPELWEYADGIDTLNFLLREI